MNFECKHKLFNTVSRFTDADPPSWLYNPLTKTGSTMDNSWFWRDHILTLSVGKSVETDFDVITRLDD